MLSFREFLNESLDEGTRISRSFMSGTKPAKRFAPLRKPKVYRPTRNGGQSNNVKPISQRLNNLANGIRKARQFVNDPHGTIKRYAQQKADNAARKVTRVVKDATGISTAERFKRKLDANRKAASNLGSAIRSGGQDKKPNY